jgi:hypothetical protein
VPSSITAACSFALSQITLRCSLDLSAWRGGCSVWATRRAVPSSQRNALSDWHYASYMGRPRFKSWPEDRLSSFKLLSFCSFVSGKCWNGVLKYATSASFQILSSCSHWNETEFLVRIARVTFLIWMTSFYDSLECVYMVLVVVTMCTSRNANISRHYSIVSGYGLDDRVIEVRSRQRRKDFFL